MRGPVLADVCERISEFLLAQPVLLSVSNTVLQHEDSTASASGSLDRAFLGLCESVNVIAAASQWRTKHMAPSLA